jgi:hypothetical protein
MPRNVEPGQVSPIKDLRYPQIPRSAAISRQAEKQAQPRVGLGLATSSLSGAPPQSRDQFIRAGASFMQTDTTSSDGYMSDDTIEWPVPPISETSPKKATAPNPLKARLETLRSNPSSANRGPPARVITPSLNEVLASDPKTVKVTVPQRSPSTKARLTPSKSKTGDLYLTVEI